MADASHVGRRYRAPGQVVDGAQAARLGKAIAGDGLVWEPAVVPPTFAAVYCLFPTLAQLFADTDVGINLAGLVHVEQSFEWPSPAQSGDVLDAIAEISSVEQKRGMTFVGIDLKATKADGAVVCTGRSLMIIRP